MEKFSLPPTINIISDEEYRAKEDEFRKQILKEETELIDSLPVELRDEYIALLMQDSL